MHDALASLSFLSNKLFMPEWDSTAEIHPDNPFADQLPDLLRKKSYSFREKESFFATLPYCRSIREAERLNKLPHGIAYYWLKDRPDLIQEMGTRFIQRFQLEAPEIVDLSFEQIRAKLPDASAKDAAVIVGIVMDKVRLAQELSAGQEVPLEQLHPSKQLEHTESLIKLLEEKKRRLLAAQDAIPVEHLQGEHIRSDSSEQQAPSAPLAVRSRSQLPLEHHSHASPPTAQTGEQSTSSPAKTKGRRGDRGVLGGNQGQKVKSAGGKIVKGNDFLPK